MVNLEYPVGGSLSKENPFYVQRPADRELYESIKAGQFCYVFNSRQMGKSSLLVRSQHQLEQEGVRCCTVDLTSIGSEAVTPPQWYKGIVFELWRGFGLRKQFNFRSWWQDESDLSVLQRLQHFVTDILLTQFSEHLVIFIDEIDCILSLPFTVDDFFALIRFCYNQRAIDPIYHRISFVLAGVATPSDLIQDKNRTPFNIGKAIELTGFDYQSATPLIQGLELVINCPDLILKEIISWTGGQPFLTQKICQLVAQTARQTIHHADCFPLALPPGTEALWISTLIHDRIIHNWESQDEPEHLRTIRDRIERSRKQQGRLLGLYQQILQTKQAGHREGYQAENWTLPFPPFIPATDSREQVELILTGLVIKHRGVLQVKNRIYQQVFNLAWVEAQLANLRPYSQSLDAWIASGQTDTSRLWRGQALKAAQQWAQGKTLSDRDYQFLAASQECDRQETQQALEAARLQEVEARLAAEQYRRKQERRAARLQRLLLIAVSLALVIAVTLGFTLRQQYEEAIERERQTKISEIHALIDSSAGLFASNQKLDALIAALRARSQLQLLEEANPPLQEQVDLMLQQAMSGADEYNRLSDPPPGRFGLAVSPDGKTIVTSGQKNTLNLWARNGQHLRTLEGHAGSVLSLAISPTGDRMATGSSDRTIRLWNLDGTFFRTLEGHQGSILTLAFSPNGQIIASGSDDTTIKLWRLDGTLIRTLTEHTGAVLSLGFTASGELISGSEDGTIKRWSQIGELRSSLNQGERVLRVAIHPEGNQIAVVSEDQTIKLWSLDGTLLTTLNGHTSPVNALAFSADGSLIVSASSDRTLKLWTTKGTLLKTFTGHTAPVADVAFVPSYNAGDRPDLVSLGWDNTVRLWHSHNQLLTSLIGHTAEVWSIAFSPGGTRLASASLDKTVRLWKIDQQNTNPQKEDQQSSIQIIPGAALLSASAVRAIAFNPNGQTLATAGADQTITLWTQDGQPQMSFKAHNSEIRALAFSPNARFLASASTDSTIKVWNLQNWQNQNHQPPPLLSTLIGHRSSVLALAFSRDSRIIASASSDGTVKLWTPDGRSLSTFRQHRQPVWAVAFSPVSTILASAGEDDKTLVWQPSGTVLNTLEGHENSVRAITFSPNGSQLASGSQNGTIKLWQQNGTLLATLKGHSASVTSLQFSPDSQLLASASEDHTVLLWDLEKVQSTDRTFAYGCQWVQDYVQTNLEQTERSLCSISPS
ncbi:MAG: AAA-like domain-containing protein [Elainellaceae cyanobacterium]